MSSGTIGLFMEDTFWTHDTLLFVGSFKYYRDKKQEVRGKIHISEEQYDFHSFGHSLERSYLTNRKGTRSYLFMRPYVQQPNIVVSFAVQPKHYADAGLVLGKTTGSRVEGFRHDEIGNAQAWYYPEGKILVLWECFLYDFLRDVPLRKDTCRPARTSGALPGNGADFCARIMRLARGAYLRTAASYLRMSRPA
jgi:hypothetical protein